VAQNTTGVVAGFTSIFQLFRVGQSCDAARLSERFEVDINTTTCYQASLASASINCLKKIVFSHISACSRSCPHHRLQDLLNYVGQYSGKIGLL
jgi:hypothetical protein